MKFDRKRQITWKGSYSWLALTMFVNGKGIYFNSKVEHEVEVIMAVFLALYTFTGSFNFYLSIGHLDLDYYPQNVCFTSHGILVHSLSSLANQIAPIIVNL